MKRLIVCIAWALAGCGPSEKTPPAKPPLQAAVAKPVKEADLTTITLTPKAEERLLIPANLGTVQRAKLPRRRTLAAEAMLPPGRSAVLSAPFTGVVEFVGEVPQAGASVTQGKPLLKLTPLPAPERLIITPAERLALEESRASLRLRVVELKAKLASDLADAEGGIARAKVAHDAALVALERAEKLVRDKAAGVRVVDEARAAADSAKAALVAAVARRDVFAGTRFEIGRALETEPAVEPAVITLDVPMTGIVRDVRVTAGQRVPAGAVLIDIMDPSVMWLRVAVPVDELADLVAGSHAEVLMPGADPKAPAIFAEPVDAPPSAAPLSETADLHFTLPAGLRLRPGQRLSVRILRAGVDEGLVVPWGAVLFDIYGGAWVYENTAPQTFVRKRVQVRRVDGRTALLADADLKVGAKIVTAGAVELFGVEFGAGK